VLHRLSWLLTPVHLCFQTGGHTFDSQSQLFLCTVLPVRLHKPLRHKLQLDCALLCCALISCPVLCCAVVRSHSSVMGCDTWYDDAMCFRNPF
jgi:hypothetical protein